MKKILMIDDDLDDQYFYRGLFSKLSSELEFECVSSDAELITKIQAYEKNQYALPNLIILDLNLPKVSGQKIFVNLRKNSNFKTIPIIVLTTSASPIDMQECKAMGVDSYFIKPIEYSECEEMVKTIFNYWFVFDMLNGF